MLYYIDKSVLVENRPLLQFIRNYIQDSSGVFSISSLVRISMTSFPAFTLFFVQKHSCLYNKKKITRWLEDMNFIFSWQKTIFYHSKIKFISSRRRVISSICATVSTFELTNDKYIAKLLMYVVPSDVNVLLISKCNKNRHKL